MKSRVFIFGLLTLLAVGIYILAVFFGAGSRLPLSVTSHGTVGRTISQARGMSLPAGLQDGDELEFQQMTPAARAAVSLTVTIKPGFSYDMVVRRGNQLYSVPVTSQVAPASSADRLNLALDDLMDFAFLTLGLLALWRGRDMAAWGLGLMAVNVVIANGLRAVPVSAPLGIGLDILDNCIVVPLIVIGLYLMAYALLGEGLSREVKRMFTAMFAALVVLLQVLSLVRTIDVVYFAAPGESKVILPGISICLALIPFVMLLFGYTRAGSEQRLRIRWILASTGLIVLVVVLAASTFLTIDAGYRLAFSYLQQLASLIAVGGYAYAVMRHRLVDVRIIINRTLVYGTITAIVIGVFAAFTSLVERATLGTNASLLLELIVPLALGIVLSTLRRHVDGYINRVLFSRQYRAEKALNDFARTCAFIEGLEELMDSTTATIFQHSGTTAVAVYERDVQGYAIVSQKGNQRFPERVKMDDPAFARLRAGDHDTDLHEVTSALGTDGYVFSMAARNKLIGALVCGPRPAEVYTAEERALLFHVSQQVVAAWQALRGREYERFVDSVASGALDAATAREQAQLLRANSQAA